MDGFFLIDKPVGVTSHDIVKRIKHIFQLNKVGHTGTLDPFASGLLIVCVGKATKLSTLLTAKDKTYTGLITLGKHYDTYDTTGKVLHEKVMEISDDKIMETAQTFVGSYLQEPPMYSAIKINGQKLYKLAYQGKAIERPKRQVDIYDFKITNIKNHDLSFSTHVSKGTYIRSLAVDFAGALGTYGALSALRRTSIGNYKIENAKLLEALTNDDLICLEHFFADYPQIMLNDYMIKLVKNGIILDERQTTIDTSFIVIDEKKQMIAFYEPINDHQYKPIIIL